MVLNIVAIASVIACAAKGGAGAGVVLWLAGVVGVSGRLSKDLI
jgi:hypothetical protein